jgi:chromosome segregation ATPase
MSENEPHVSSDELRAALAPRGESRRNPVLVSDRSEQASAELLELRAALESSRDDAGELRVQLDAARADSIELRAALDAARGDANELRAELASVKTESRERRIGLDRLAGAGVFKRRGVIRDLEERGLF